jgi:CheY-like chemotaxis protein
MHIKNVSYYYDEEWMRKVLVNLLSNAIKFTPDGGAVTLYISSFTNEQGKERLYISVSDTGVGILPEDLKRIFDRFYQSRKHVKFPMYGQSGTGIGLYLCKRIVNEHGGEISAHNNKRCGSAIRIIMPTKTNKADEAVSNEDKHDSYPMLQPLQTVDNLDKKTILVVDDNPDMRVYVTSILNKEYRILQADNGKTALQVLHEQQVDFIVSDLMMPEMDGIEMSRRIKDDLNISHIPILMLTAKVSNQAQIESFKIGVDEYLQKPFEEELLRVRISNIFNSRKKVQEQFAQQLNPGVLNIESETRDSKFLKKIMSVMEERYKDPDFDVNAYAESMGMSRTLLNVKLQNLIGQSTSKFISNYRLKQALTLIQVNKVSKNMNVSDIAYAVGFNDPKYFSRCYLKKYGVLPSASLDEG